MVVEFAGRDLLLLSSVLSGPAGFPRAESGFSWTGPKAHPVPSALDFPSRKIAQRRLRHSAAKLLNQEQVPPGELRGLQSSALLQGCETHSVGTGGCCANFEAPSDQAV